MPGKRIPFPSTARKRGREVALCPLLALLATLSACKKAPETAGDKPSQAPATAPAPEPPPATDELLAQLAGARIDAAKEKLADRHPEEALPLLVSALKADPSSEEARGLVETILRETTWNLPVVTLAHHMPVQQIAWAAPATLWTSLGGKLNTTVRWNLETLRIESVLFPATDANTRFLVFDPSHRWMVVGRGEVNLLCDARTLKPIRDLGPLPANIAPASALVFSPDGLLMAQPGFVSEKDHSLVWHIRDSATGEIIRSSEPVAQDAPQPLAASMDHTLLRVLHSDGSLLKVPLSPVAEIEKIPMPEPVKLLEAQFSEDGQSVLAARDAGSYQPPETSIISYSDADDGSLDEQALARRFPWSRDSNIWTSRLHDPKQSPFTVDDRTLVIETSPHAPLQTVSPISAVSFLANEVITGEEDGTVIQHRLLPLPGTRERKASPGPLNRETLGLLEKASEALTGIRHDEKARSFTRISPEDRAKAFHETDLRKLGEVAFPFLDFDPVIAGFSVAPRVPAADAFIPLWDRLANEAPTMWPELLEWSKDLAANPWREKLAAAVTGPKADYLPVLGDNPWMQSVPVATAIEGKDTAALNTTISEAGGKGAVAAKALELALASEDAERIESILAMARNMPPILEQIARSRVAWLQGRKADALSTWPENFPEMVHFRTREDWEGWELADFRPALEEIRRHVTEELAAITVPEDSTPEQRKAVAERLADPVTLATVGRSRFALASMNAALAFSAHKEEVETTFKLANQAREMGAPPEPCLRAEALALTAMGDYQKAHPRWVELLTEHPIETTIPGDYAEAAYTAFENAEPKQAMEILTAGRHRFPQDGNFALRAGWVALLTGNPERAYQFLQDGKRIGFPEEKEENALALLVIAAAQSGAHDDAAVYFQDLLRLDRAWIELKTLDTLDWPPELKASLAEFMR